MSKTFYTYPLPVNPELSPMETDRHGTYRLTPETVKVVDQCPYCNRDTSDSENYVRLHGVVYRQCGVNEGHNAGEPATWSGYLGGALVYDIPLLIFGLVILVIEYFIGPHFDRLFLSQAWMIRAVVYGVFSLVPAVACWWAGLPVMIAPAALSLMSYLIIIN